MLEHQSARAFSGSMAGILLMRTLAASVLSILRGLQKPLGKPKRLFYWVGCAVLSAGGCEALSDGLETGLSFVS